MTIKTPEQIAEEAARTVLRDNGLKNPAREDPLVTLGFEMGDGIEYEEALKQFALAAIEADRAQRQSDRYAEARAALEEYDAGNPDDPAEENLELADKVIEAIRPTFRHDEWDIVHSLPTEYGLYQQVGVNYEASVENAVTYRHSATKGWVNAFNNTPLSQEAKEQLAKKGLVRLVRES